MNFPNIKEITIPEGKVAKIMDAQGRVLWQKIGSFPDGYQLIEYIGLNGSQGIQYMDYFAEETELSLTFAPTTFAGSYVGGSYTNFANASLRRSYMNWRQSGSGKWLESYVNNASANLKTPSLTLNKIYTVTDRANASTLEHVFITESNGSVLATRTETFPTISATIGVSLKFGIGCNGYLARDGSTGTFAGAGCLRGKIYSYQHKRNGVVVHNFVPCRRQADNVVGMYDTITHTFYGNSGIGSFTEGPAI